MQIESDQFFADCAGAAFWQTDGDDQQYKRGTFNNMRGWQELQHCVHQSTITIAQFFQRRIIDEIWTIEKDLM